TILYSLLATRYSLLLRLLEIPRVGRLLALARGHQQAVGAQEIVLLADGHVAVAFRADEFGPIGPRVGIADIGPGHRPRPRQGMIKHRDLVVHEALVGLVERDALLEDRLVVMVQRHAGGVVMARALETAGLDLERVET